MTDEEKELTLKLNKIAFEAQRIIREKYPDRYESQFDYNITNSVEYDYLYDKQEDIHYRWYRQKKDVPKIGYKNLELDDFRKMMDHFTHQELLEALNTIFAMDEFKDVLPELFERSANDNLIALFFSITRAALTTSDLW